MSMSIYYGVIVDESGKVVEYTHRFVENGRRAAMIEKLPDGRTAQYIKVAKVDQLDPALNEPAVADLVCDLAAVAYTEIFHEDVGQAPTGWSLEAINWWFSSPGVVGSWWSWLVSTTVRAEDEADLWADCVRGFTGELYLPTEESDTE